MVNPKQQARLYNESVGDCPLSVTVTDSEAVHTALEDALQKLSWEESNYARIAFLLLDAPPHYEQKVLKSIHSSVKMYAAKGIKLIPVAASGIDKKTEQLNSLIVRLIKKYTE